MKKLSLLPIFLFIFCSCYSQSVKQDSKGNYYAVSKTQDTVLKNTGKTFTTAKGEIFTVYVSAKDKYYVIRTSKAGNTYKQYLKTN